MKVKKVRIYFFRYSVPDLLEIANFIILKMTGNANFPTPFPTIVDVTSLADDLDEKNTLAVDGGKLAVADMNKARIKLCDALRTLGLYVETTSNGDEGKKLSSGFPLSKDPNPKHLPEIKIQNGPNSGDILIRTTTIVDAVAYIYQYFVGENPPVDNDAWKLGKGATQTKIDLHDFSEGAKIWIRYCGITRTAMTGWSEPRHFIVG